MKRPRKQARRGRRSKKAPLPRKKRLERRATPPGFFESPPEMESVGSPAFARHETFAPRFGWLKKGFDGAGSESKLFLLTDAHLRLGVGKNMARSIRYWCHATGLLDERPIPGKRGTASTPSAFGTLLLGENGWDPFLEDPASLWLLHWKLVRYPTVAAFWHFAFTLLSEVEFSTDSLAADTEAYFKGRLQSDRVVYAAFEKDANCLVRMYADAADSPEAFSEESIHSPFADLGLIRRSASSGARRSDRYRFEVGRKLSLPASHVAASCLEFASRVAPGAQTIALSRLLSDPGSPGMAFKLGESALIGYLEEAELLTKQLHFGDAGGLVQLSFDGRPSTLATSLLAAYYAKVSKRAAA